MIKRGVAVLAFAMAAGCATHPSQIRPQFVSSVPYQALSCDQLIQLDENLQHSIKAASSEQEGAAAHDSLMATAAIFVPLVALAIGSTGNRGDEIGRLKGEQVAVYQAGSLKDCWVGVPEAN